jgi:single-stranded-DNA-specific exonuclease
MGRSWTERHVDPDAARRLAKECEVPLLAARLLVQRGLGSADEVRRYLDPRLADLPDPGLMKGMAEAAALLADAIEAGEPVAVLGDYDVDGITSVTQVMLFFRALGRPATFHIPHRVHDGYGLSESAVARLLDEGVRTFVTVDTGIGEVATIGRMKARGARVVVIDHHELGDALPPADAIVNPHQPGCGFPHQDLAACALTFYVLAAVRRELTSRGWFEAAGVAVPDKTEPLDLVALGTVADVVPLTGANRILARHGLKRLRAQERPGVKCLVDVSPIRTRKLDAGHISFHLAPRLNAGGRVDVADTGVHLLLATDPREAARLAAKLDALNRERQVLEREATAAAVAAQEADPRLAEGGGIVAADEGWHVGVVGIMAGRLAERFHRPALVLARDGDAWRGSGRSIEGFDLVRHLEQGRHLLRTLGGHAFACGLSVEDGRLAEFADWFRTTTAAALAALPPPKASEVDAVARLEAVLDPRFLDVYRELWPFGQANPRPTFLLPGVHLTEVLDDRGTSKRLRVVDGDTETTVTFWSAQGAPEVPAHVDLVARLDLFDYRGAEVAGLTAVDTLDPVAP